MKRREEPQIYVVALFAKHWKMTRNELYNKITPCGDLDYPSMIYLIMGVEFLDESIRLLLLDRVGQGGNFSREDWLLFIQHVTFLPSPSIPKETAIAWLSAKCSYNATELKAILESVKFTDGSQPTIILSQTGDIIISE